MSLAQPSTPIRLVHVMAVAAASALAGCGHMPVSSMIALRKVDFATTDPAVMRAAIKLPAGVQPLSPNLTIVVATKDGSRQERSFPLQPIEDPAAGDAAAPTRGERVFAFRFSDHDAAQIGAFRTEILAHRKAAGGSGGSLTINIGSKACHDGEAPWQAPLPMSSYLKTGETGRYVVLARDIDLVEEVKKHAPGSTLPAIPPCGSHPD